MAGSIGSGMPRRLIGRFSSSRNLGLGGIFAQSSFQLPGGLPLRIEMPLPEGPSLGARVSHVVLDSDARSGIGVEFIDLDRESRERLLRYFAPRRYLRFYEAFAKEFLHLKKEVPLRDCSGPEPMGGMEKGGKRRSRERLARESSAPPLARQTFSTSPIGSLKRASPLTCAREAVPGEHDTPWPDDLEEPGERGIRAPLPGGAILPALNSGCRACWPCSGSHWGEVNPESSSRETASAVGHRPARPPAPLCPVWYLHPRWLPPRDCARVSPEGTLASTTRTAEQGT